MKQRIYAIFDSKAGIYSQPHLFINDNIAKRGWIATACDPSTVFSQNPEDYTMFHLGEFDDETGEVSPAVHKTSLGTALEVQAIGFKMMAERPQRPVSPAAGPEVPFEITKQKSSSNTKQKRN